MKRDSDRQKIDEREKRESEESKGKKRTDWAIRGNRQMTRVERREGTDFSLSPISNSRGVVLLSLPLSVYNGIPLVLCLLSLLAYLSASLSLYSASPSSFSLPSLRSSLQYSGRDDCGEREAKRKKNATEEREQRTERK